eukprot:COSAG05_NODE_5586_length_1135_cov_1.300193_1_plen_260_part_10
MITFDSIQSDGLVARWTQDCCAKGHPDCGYTSPDPNCPGRQTMNIWRLVELFASFLVGSAGGSLAGPPSSAIIPETIPVRQRGQMVAISSWFDTIVNMGGSFVGYMYGEGVTGFSENTIWWINIANGPITTFLVLLSFNGTAFTDCSWHGIWKPEKPKSKKVIAEHKMLDEKAELKRQHAAMRGKEVTKLEVLWAELKYFTTAFSDTCYRNLWIQGLIGTIGGIIMWQFGFYWYQDAFPYGYRFFGYQLLAPAQQSTHAH